MTGVSTEGGPEHIFHITERSAFAASLETGAYETDSLKKEGFLHCSTREQLAQTAARFFAGRSGLAILCIEAARLGVQPATRPLTARPFRIATARFHSTQS